MTSSKASWGQAKLVPFTWFFFHERSVWQRYNKFFPAITLYIELLADAVAAYHGHDPRGATVQKPSVCWIWRRRLEELGTVHFLLRVSYHEVAIKGCNVAVLGYRIRLSHHHSHQTITSMHRTPRHPNPAR